MKYKEIDFNGRKLRIKTFDYDTPEGWKEFVKATAGSITDESFVRPADAYFGFDEVPSFDEENILSRQ